MTGELMNLMLAALTGGGFTSALNYLTRKRRDQRRDAKRFDEITLAVYERVAAAQKELMANLQKEVSDLRVKLGEVQGVNASLVVTTRDLEKRNGELVEMIRDLEKRNQKLTRENHNLTRRVKDLEKELKAHGLDRPGETRPEADQGKTDE